jgi:hypothetical protein
MYLPNPRPGECLTSYSGDQAHTWVAAAGSQVGAQPISDTNPSGTYPGVPAMSVTAEVADRLEGPQAG